MNNVDSGADPRGHVDDGPEGLHREAMRLMHAKDWPNALLQIERALRAGAAAPRWLLSKAQCLLALARRAEAYEVAVAALEVSTDPVLLDALGSFLSFIDEQPTALEAFERAVALAPDDPHFLFNRATVRRFLGQFEGAEADYDRVIALRPTDFEAYKNRSDLRQQTADSNHVAELEGLAARGFEDWRGEVQIHYALAKEHEDLGEYAKSFGHLRRGAAKRRQHLRYDVANDVATVDWIIDAFPAAVAAAQSSVVPLPAATMRTAPIFIVGLPRSGTTLVDRILSSHPEVRSAGELNDFALALVARVRSAHGGAQLPRSELVARAAHIDFAALGRDYLGRARAAVGEGRFTDKMPLNYLYCGLIRRALPDAKIVHLTRHPMAAGYAMYKTLFKDGYPFSYDLGDLGRYYVAYARLMAHWHASLPGVIHEVNYERLIADQLGETRTLLEFCGLEWHDACLDFHRNSTATTTASASQIRRPLYDSSVSQWRHYEMQLAELSDHFRATGIAL